LNLEEARSVVVGALGETAHSFDSSAVSARLQSPDGDIALKELELDSLDMVEWTVEIEKRCGIGLDTADLAGAVMLSDVLAVLVSRAEEAA
jgi:acyl carrier protein